MLENPNPYVTLSEKTVDDFVKEPDIKTFFMNSIDNFLEQYEPGRPEYKPEVHQQIQELTKKRTEAIENHQKMMQQQQRNTMNTNPMDLVIAYEKKLSEQSQMLQTILQENNTLRTKVEYLENKINEIIKKSIKEKTEMREKSMVITDVNSV
jgi:BMFP domain-containing protein YqiC